MAPLVIVGSGLAGYNLARELRKRDKETPLTLITMDSGYFYSKPTLSNALALGVSPTEIPLSTSEDMASRLRAIIRTRCRVESIDLGRRCIRTADGEESYSHLVLALGADQIRLAMPGDAASAVLSVNDLDDYTKFRFAITGKRRVLVIGAGLIGCEFANDLVVAGYIVHVVDIAQWPLSKLLPPAAAMFFKKSLSKQGVEWHLETSIKQVDRTGEFLTITLSNGAKVVTDVAISAVGLRPRTTLARAAGLATASGIAVNRYLETSAPNVYALGDCAEVDGLVLPYVTPLTQSARALAATLTGKLTPVSYPPMPVIVKTPACPTIVSPPHNGAEGVWHAEHENSGVKVTFSDGLGRLLGFALCGSATSECAKLSQQLPPLLA